MIMLIHILIAVTSVILSLYMLAASADRAERLMKFVAASAGATIVSGVALIALSPAALAHVCVSGAIFTVFTVVAYVAARRRVAAGVAA